MQIILDDKDNYKQINNHDEIKISDLNHPWFIYPHAFMSEYNNYELYKVESLRLLNFLEDFINKFDNHHFTNYKILIPIILGSTMEDALNNSYDDYSNIFQYQQLFPNYINNFIENVEDHKFIQLIIISPDSIFTNTDYKPFFVKFSKYKFDKINKYEYICHGDKLIIKVNIFNCPMVSKEKRKNIITKCDKLLNNFDKNIIRLNINTYVQSESDLRLIEKIYDCMNKIFSYTFTNSYTNLNDVLTVDDTNQIKKINIIVNSWVSFKNLYGYSENYNMFPELLNLASKYNIIATEWNYKDDNIYTIIKSNYHFNNLYFNHKKIIYVNSFDIDNDNDNNSDQNYNFVNHKMNNGYFIIDFVESHLIKKITCDI